MRSRPSSSTPQLGGRLSVDFANIGLSSSQQHARNLDWDQFVGYLEASHVVSAERGAHLLHLPNSDPQAAEALLSRAERLRQAIREVFAASIRKTKMPHSQIEAINEAKALSLAHS